MVLRIKSWKFSLKPILVIALTKKWGHGRNECSTVFMYKEMVFEGFFGRKVGIFWSKQNEPIAFDLSIFDVYC